MAEEKLFKPIGVNVIEGFTTSGVHENVGGYTYVLLVNWIGQAMIQRIKSDNSEIKFTTKTRQESINSFWANYATHTYEWINETKDNLE